MNGNLARSILCSLVTSVDFGCYSSIVGVCFCGDWPCCVMAERGQTMNAAEATTKIVETRRMVRREFIVPLGFRFPGYLRTGKRTSDVESSAGISGNASAQAVLLILLEQPGLIGWNSRDEMMVEATSIDRQGSTTLPRVPPPVSNQPIETTAARHNVFSCGRLFRLGLAVQLVSGPGQPFHTRILVFSHFVLASHQRAEESVARLFLDSTSVRQKRRTSFVF